MLNTMTQLLTPATPPNQCLGVQTYREVDTIQPLVYKLMIKVITQ